MQSASFNALYYKNYLEATLSMGITFSSQDLEEKKREKETEKRILRSMPEHQMDKASAKNMLSAESNMEK